MENMEKGKFEDEWKDAFDSAERSPSDSVWLNIELKLENEKMKRRIIYYQRLAAASILFALLLGAWGVTSYYDKEGSQSLVIHERKNDLKKKESSIDLKSSEKEHLADDAINEDDKNDERFVYDETRDFGNSATGDANQVLLKNNSDADSDIKNPSFIAEQNTIREERSISTRVPFSKNYGSPIFTQKDLPQPKNEEKQKENIFSVAQTFPEVSKEEKRKRQEDVWLSFGGAAGNYNPGSASQTMLSPSLTSSFQNSPTSTPSSSGVAYSMGLTVGKKIAERWIIQSGVNYMTQAINYTSNMITYSSANDAKASILEYADRNSPVTETQPYQVNSSMEFMSVPLQAGYLIVDRKIGVQLNVGVATDIFLRNTLKDRSGQTSTYSQSGGESSPYRSMNWAGLASTELSYKIARQYRISLLPGLRYSFQPALKSASNSTLNPFVVDIGFRFRYIFK